jgi:hypothetical protein
MALPILFKFKISGRKIQIMIVRRVTGYIHEIVPAGTMWPVELPPKRSKDIRLKS